MRAILLKQSLKIFASTWLLASTTNADEIDVSGAIGVELNNYLHQPQFTNQSTRTTQPSFFIEPEFGYKIGDNGYAETKLFARYDPYSKARSHFDIRQLDYLYQANNYEFSIGISKVFWGVLESNHLVDIINQYDQLEDVDNEDRLGQPMLQTAYFSDYGTFRLFYLPYFREPDFLDKTSRLRPQFIANNNALYEGNAKQWQPSFAARYTHVLGNFDIGLSHFSGINRAPSFVTNTSGIQPYYQNIQQTGIDIQYTNDDYLLKLEAIGNNGYSRYYTAFGTGIEYSFYNINDTGLDIGLLAEYHFDDRPEDAPTTTLQNDIFIGTRLALNDEDDTTLLAGGMYDTDNDSIFYTAEAQTRFNNDFTINIDARLFNNIPQNEFTNFLNKDDFIRVTLTKWF